jgi:hypothetical protein
MLSLKLQRRQVLKKRNKAEQTRYRNMLASVKKEVAGAASHQATLARVRDGIARSQRVGVPAKLNGMASLKN